MTGPEHYKEAEVLLEAHARISAQLRDHLANQVRPSRDDANDISHVAETSNGLLAAAQVHATLALAAAAAQAPMMQRGDQVHTAWHEAVSR